MTSSLTVRITVRGRLSRQLAEATFHPLTAVCRKGRTDLIGVVADQAQLHGVMARIRDLGLEVETLTVHHTPPRTTAHDAPDITPTGSRQRAAHSDRTPDDH